MLVLILINWRMLYEVSLTGSKKTEFSSWKLGIWLMFIAIFGSIPSTMSTWIITPLVRLRNYLVALEWSCSRYSESALREAQLGSCLKRLAALLKETTP